MGYASRKRDLVEKLGRSHDGGVDGIICQDPLGLEMILLQGKRLKPNSTVSSGQVRDFIGTLETRQARKGVFVTTGLFSAQARAAVSSVSHRIKLIDGRELSGLMVRHNLGVRPTQSFVFKELDRSYFAPGSNKHSRFDPAPQVGLGYRLQRQRLRDKYRYRDSSCHPAAIAAPTVHEYQACAHGLLPFCCHTTTDCGTVRA